MCELAGVRRDPPSCEMGHSAASGSAAACGSDVKVEVTELEHSDPIQVHNVAAMSPEEAQRAYSNRKRRNAHDALVRWTRMLVALEKRGRGDTETAEDMRRRIGEAQKELQDRAEESNTG
jgi:hypothetical protein